MRWSLATVALVPRGVTAHATPDEQQRVLAWAARTGFSGIELSAHWLNIDEAPLSELARFRREAQDLGICILGINVNRCLFTRGSRAQEALARMWRAIDVAALLETKLVTISLSLPLDVALRPILRGSEVLDDERDRTADELRRLADHAAQHGIELSLELHDDGILDTAEYCVDMLHRVDASNIGVNPDLGNLVRSCPSAPDWRAALKLLAPLANNWHVKNYRSAKPAFLWDGDIDYSEAVKIMQSAGYQGWVSIESYFGDPFELQERSLAYLKELAAEKKISISEQESVA